MTAPDATPETLFAAWPMLSPATRLTIVETVRPLLPYLPDCTPPVDSPIATDRAVVAMVWPDLPAATRALALARVDLDLAVRWEVAVHEAGHAVTALAFRRDDPDPAEVGVIRAAIGEGLGGAAGELTPGPQKCDRVVSWMIVAGGLAAVALIDRLGPRPALRPHGPAPKAPAAGDAGGDDGKAAECRAWADEGGRVSDGRRLIEFCTQDHNEHRPWTWATQHALIIEAARTTLLESLPALRASARHLYRHGWFEVRSVGELMDLTRADTGGLAAAPRDEPDSDERTHDDGTTGSCS